MKEVTINMIKEIELDNRLAYKNNKSWNNRNKISALLVSKYKHKEYSAYIVKRRKTHENYIVFFSINKTYIKISFDNVLRSIYVDSETKKDIINIYKLMEGYN
jgi:hypothetical protein